MKRLLDRLMYKLGYVTRERYFRAAAPKIAMALDECVCAAIHNGPCGDSRIVITTDYRRGIPCS